MENKAKYYSSAASPNDWKTLPNLINFNINQKLLAIQTCMPVIVTKVTLNNYFTGMVDVYPMLQQIGNDGSLWDYTTLYNLPFVRVQGGENAIIIDPKINDIGLVVFSSRDITTVKNTRKKGKPGSYRTHDLSDGIYIGGILNNTPTRFIRFDSAGITITANTNLTINADVTINGTLTNNGVNVGSTHKHSGVQTGGGNTGDPI